MATAQALPQLEVRRPPTAAGELASILAGPLPALPPGDVAKVSAELRAMSSRDAGDVWRHPGWSALIGWILGRCPECDPITAAVHAIRNAARAVDDAGYAVSLARYVRRIAENSAVDRPPASEMIELTWDLPEPEHRFPCTSTSLAVEAADLLRAVRVVVSQPAWEVIVPSIDIAVDWWDTLASRTGLAGDALVAVARQTNRITVDWRLRAHFEGPAARPLVALLMGGDNIGRWARRDAGTEIGLVYWSLLGRRANLAGEIPPVPPAPVARGWATSIQWVEKVVDPGGDSADPRIGPIVAA